MAFRGNILFIPRSLGLTFIVYVILGIAVALLVASLARIIDTPQYCPQCGKDLQDNDFPNKKRRNRKLKQEIIESVTLLFFYGRWECRISAMGGKFVGKVILG